jgi:hypothetical protein
MTSLQPFFPGESAGVAEALNANFAYLYSLITGTFGVPAVASGSGTAIAISSISDFIPGTARGQGYAYAYSYGTLSQAQTVGNASGSASVLQGYAYDNAIMVGSAYGSSNVTGLDTAGGAFQSVGTASGVTGTDIGVLKDNSTSVTSGGGATGADLAITNYLFAVAAVASGATGADNAVGYGSATETSSGSYSPQIASSIPIIYASNIPGSVPTGALNSFDIDSNFRVVYNGVADTTTQAIQLYYANHTLYYENFAGQWYMWASAGVWTAVVSPIPSVVYESVNGTYFTSAGNIIYASATPGTAPAANATVANSGLITFSMTANPGQIIGGLGGNGVIDPPTGGVTAICYFNHYFWQYYGAGATWYQYQGSGAPNNGYSSGTQTNPLPTVKSLYVQTIPPQQNLAAFMVSGAYADWSQASSTNLIRISTPQGQGAITGTPGTLPANWGNSIPGLTQTVVGFGTDATTLLPYIDIQLSGNPTAAGSIYFDTTTGIPVSASSPYYLSAYIGLVGGTNANIANVGLAAWEYASGVYTNNAYTTSAGSPPSTPTFYSYTFTTGSTATSIRPSFLLNIGGGAAINATYRIAGVMLNAGTTTIGFVPTPQASQFPTLQYQDSGSPIWKPVISNAGVGTQDWSFVHPPFPSGYTNATQTVTVRDADAPTVTAASNAFSVSTAGVTTLQGINIGGTLYTNGQVVPAISLAGGQQSGTAIESLTVSVAPGVFSGTVSVSPTSYGWSNGNLVNNVVLGSGNSATLTITASQPGASNSPIVVTQAVTVSAESPNGKVLTSPASGLISGSATPTVAGSTYSWSLSGTAGAYYAALSINGGATVVQTTSTAAVAQLYYINHTLYQQNTSLNWWYFNGTSVSNGVVGTGGWTSCASPIPVIAVDQPAGTPITSFFTTNTQVGTLTMTTQGPIGGGTGTINLSPTWAISGSGASEFNLNTATGVLTLAATATSGTTYSFTATATY